MRFTREEFDIMASQMLEQKPISYEMLTQIAEKTLRRTVKNGCASDLCLRGRGYEDDIMQEIHIRLIKTTVPYFLRRNGVTEGFNNDPEGFEDWMFRVAENLKKDFANKVRGLDFKTEDLDAPQVESLTASYDHHEDAQEREALLKEAETLRQGDYQDDPLGGMTQEEYDEMYERIRAELMEELMHVAEETENK